MLSGMNLPALTRQQSRQIDRRAIDQYGIPGMVLMENAGRGVVDWLLGADAGLGDAPARFTACSVAILCGKGNNAGDGLVIARHLEIQGVASRVFLLCPPSEFQGDAQRNYDILRHSDVSLVEVSTVDDLSAALDAEAAGAAWLIDAMLGTGAHGQPREPFRTAIAWMNRQDARRLAVDVPSGLDCDTGQPAEPTVRADHTCSFVAPKVGFSAPAAREYLGQLHVVSIGIPPRLIGEVLENPRD